MKKLTPKNAKSIALKYLKKHREKEGRYFAKVHTEAVVQIGKMLAKRLGATISIVEMCAWVHDIGSVVERNDHAKHSLDLLEKEGFEISELIKDCVLNHGTSGQPKSEEAKILQMADKLSILSIPVLKILFNQKNITASDTDFVSKMTTGAVDHLKKLIS